MSLLETRNLVAGYGRGFRIGPAELRLDAGVVHVVGPNGGGKTTLLRTLCGGLMPLAGDVRVDAHDVHRVTRARRDIALVASIPELPDFLTVGEAWRFTAAIRRADGWDGNALCADLGIDPGMPLASASAGQRQKAELVCGLAGDPRVLLLDETFAHLDGAATKLLCGWIAAWGATRLVLFTHHGAPPLAPHATLHVAAAGITLEPR